MSEKIVYSPSYCIFHDKENYYMEIELPGIKKKDIEVEMTENSICVRGEKEDLIYSGCWALYHSVDPKKAVAKFDSGLLKITIPFKEPIKTVKVKIK
ncbi:MAG: Hsp20/alpha crystallin family protein [Candidatus Freyarchaeota archaeon]|nr:Hsp20/alpha crystallin family protein [Candidatus Freyarchaeota archaeon]